MVKIISRGSGFIEVNGILENLQQFRSIKQYTFGLHEDPEGQHYYGIQVTPLTPSEQDIKNGVDGTYFLTTYSKNDKEEFELDYSTIMQAMGN